ncbi:ABC transporter substrate-binding protein, partial [Streptococcus agalactiae]|nr:ABC transporter substrate-binding protein [Streptococcus agalactiae]
SDYSKGVAKSFKESYSGKIVDSMTFSAGDTDFQASLTKLKGKEYDAIVMPGYYTETGLIVKQARDLGISKPVLGPDGFDSPKFVQSTTPVGASNVYYLTGFTTQGSTKAKAFHDHYVKAYGEEPSMFSALSYDAVYMAAKSAKGAKTSIDIKKALAKLKDFKGVTGKMSIDKNHNVVKSAYVVKLEDGKTSSVNIISAK